MNKKEKSYFIGKLFTNHINLSHNPKLQYYVNTEILLMFKHFDLIDKKLYDTVVGLIYECAYDDKYSSLTTAQRLLAQELGLKIEY